MSYPSDCRSGDRCESSSGVTSCNPINIGLGDCSDSSLAISVIRADGFGRSNQILYVQMENGMISSFLSIDVDEEEVLSTLTSSFNAFLGCFLFNDVFGVASNITISSSEFVKSIHVSLTEDALLGAFTLAFFMTFAAGFESSSVSTSFFSSFD